MTLTITYPLTGTRIHHGLTQAEVNRLITHISDLNDQAPLPCITLKVSA